MPNIEFWTWFCILNILRIWFSGGISSHPSIKSDNKWNHMENIRKKYSSTIQSQTKVDIDWWTKCSWLKNLINLILYLQTKTTHRNICSGGVMRTIYDSMWLTAPAILCVKSDVRQIFLCRHTPLLWLINYRREYCIASGTILLKFSLLSTEFSFY